MPTPESFDAFYARTVQTVTGEMHARAGNVSEADHAIREAYARAYQQWYQIAGYRDPEGWVLGVATEAYERRLANLGEAGLGQAPDQASPGTNQSTWPGIYRPRPPAEEVAGPPAIAPPPVQNGASAAAASPAAASPVTASPVAASPASAGPPRRPVTAGAVLGGPGPSSPDAAWGAPTWSMATDLPNRNATLGLAAPDRAGFEDAAADAGPPGSPPSPGSRLRRPSGRGPAAPSRLPTRLPSRPPRRVVLITAVALAVVVAGVAYLSVGRGGHKASPAAAPPKAATKPVPSRPQMLAAGHTGGRAAVPWSLVGPGWTLVDYSAASTSDIQAAGYTIYLVDPEGGKYLIRQLPAGPQTLLAWSGNASMALLGSPSEPAEAGGQVAYGAYVPATGGGQLGYSLLDVRTGQVSPLSLPSNVFLAGFTKPDGLNILAIRETSAEFQLRRYNLQGVFQANLIKLHRPAGVAADVCSSACAAISSPDGLTAVWGVAGAEMELVSNAGGLIRKLHVPDSGKPPSCVPVSWWNATTVLANCAAPDQPAADSERLWLVPDDGATPTPLTAASGQQSGDGFLRSAWQAGGQVYATQTTAAQCASAPSGPVGLGIVQVSAAGSTAAVDVQGSTNDYNNVVAGVGSRLLVLSQAACRGPSSLAWLTPATGAADVLLTAGAGQLGVVAAARFGA